MTEFAERHLAVAGPVTVGGRRIKRYRISRDGRSVASRITVAADVFLPRLLPAFDEPAPAAGFSVLHHGEDAVWLTLYCWVREAILHARTASAAGPAWEPAACDGDATDFTVLATPYVGCVWELPVLAHERAAWVRHMLTPRRPDPAAYLGDTASSGPVGRP